MITSAVDIVLLVAFIYFIFIFFTLKGDGETH